MTELRHLSHSRLVLRTKYYREQTMHLEKQIQVASEKIAQLKKKISLLQAENQNLHIQNEELSVRMDSHQLEKLEQENVLLLKELQKLSSESQKDGSNIDDKIKEYEQLLSDIQVEITEKEQELTYYKSKVQAMEKGKRVYSTAMHDDPQVSHKSITESPHEPVIAYFDYALIKKSDENWIIFGDFHIKNISNESLHHPNVCFRFSLPEVANVKGKILTTEQVELNQQIQENTDGDWMFLQSNWTEEAKERGEIWIAPIHPMRLHRGETFSLSRFQIPLTLQYSDSLIIEGFVYFSDSNTKTKSQNNIVITY